MDKNETLLIHDGKFNVTIGSCFLRGKTIILFPVFKTNFFYISVATIYWSFSSFFDSLNFKLMGKHVKYHFNLIQFV